MGRCILNHNLHLFLFSDSEHLLIADYRTVYASLNCNERTIAWEYANFVDGNGSFVEEQEPRSTTLSLAEAH